MNENKTVIEITAEENKVYKLTLKEPDFQAYAKALNILNSSTDGVLNMIEAGDAIVLNCVIPEESDNIVLSRPDLRVLACQAATGLLKVWSTDIKKN